MNILSFLFLSLLIGTTPVVFADECTLFAGTGVKGFSGDGAPAAQAQLNNPYGVFRAPDGTVFICDTDNQRIRKVMDGKIFTIAGTGEKGFSGDGGPALKANLNEPYEVRLRGNQLVFVERMNHCIRSVNLDSGRIETIAGKGSPGFTGDNGPATNALFNQPHSIQFDSRGELFICDILNHRLRRIKNGIVTTIGGTGEKVSTREGAPLEGNPLKGPRALDFAIDGTLWLALREGNAIYKSDFKTVTHVAGTGVSGNQDGLAKEARLSGPKGISVAPDGNIYFADTESHTIRKINLKNGRVEKVAGTGKKGSGLDSDPLKTELNRPHGIFVQDDGSILVGDSENHRVLLVKIKN